MNSTQGSSETPHETRKPESREGLVTVHLEQVQPVQDHHGLDQITLEVNMPIKTNIS